MGPSYELLNGAQVNQQIDAAERIGTGTHRQEKDEETIQKDKIVLKKFWSQIISVFMGIDTPLSDCSSQPQSFS